MSNKNSLGYWYPRLQGLNLPLPETYVQELGTDGGILIGVLDGDQHAEEVFTALVRVMQGWCKTVGYPAFMRTGHTSGKHSWAHTCFVEAEEYVATHIAALIEESECSGMFGLPLDCWVVRKMIPTVPLFYCNGYAGFPVVREFRVFATGVETYHIQPYWPEEAVEEGLPSREDWQGRLTVANRLDLSTKNYLSHLAILAARGVADNDEELWSVDFLQAEDGEWWLTDMALGADSFRYGDSL